MGTSVTMEKLDMAAHMDYLSAGEVEKKQNPWSSLTNYSNEICLSRFSDSQK